MLISRFREGLTPRSTEEPVCIPLPEDPSAAMLDLCSILHIRTLRDWDQEEQESVIRFLDLAIAADKYICQEAVTLATEGLLSRYALTVNGHHQNILSLAVSSAVSYWIDNGHYFGIFTKCIVLDTNEPLNLLSGRRAASVLTEDVLRKFSRAPAGCQTRLCS